MLTQGRSRTTGTLLFLAGVTIVGLALRLSSLNDSLNGDELSTNFVVHGFGVGGIVQLVAGDQEVTPPLFFLLTSLTKGIGDVEGLRLVSLLAGLGLIPLTYLLGLRTVGRAAASVAAALVALSPFLIFYSTEARAYTLVTLLLLLTVLFLLKALDTGAARWWVLYAVCAAGATYTHYTSIFLLAGVFLWAFIAHPEARVPLALATLGGGLLYGPWVPQMMADHDNPTARVFEVLDPLSWASVRVNVDRWAIGHPYFGIDDLPGILAQWLIGAALVLGSVGAFLRVRGKPSASWRPPSGVALVLVLACANPVGVLLVSLVDYTIFASRNLAVSWPGLALVFGVVVTAGRGWLRYAAVGLLVAGFSMGAVRMLDEENHRPDMRSAADFINSTGDPGAPVIEFPLPSPGPQTALEAALAPKGEALPADRKILVVGKPTFETRLRAAAPGEPNALGIYLPRPTTEELVRRGARIAGSGTLFVLTPANVPLDQLLPTVPRRFREVGSRTFKGFGAPYLTVHVLEGGSA